MSPYSEIDARTTTVSGPNTTGSFIGSDILQSTGTIFVGAGTELVTKTAGGYNFTPYNYPLTIQYGVQGKFTSGPEMNNSPGYLWPGTQTTSGSYPDITTPIAFYNIQKNSILVGLNVVANISPTITNTIVVYKNTSSLQVSTILTGSMLQNSYFSTSIVFLKGDKLSVGILTSAPKGGNNLQDLSVEVNLF